MLQISNRAVSKAYASALRCPRLCARTLDGRLSVRPPVHRSSMALPFTVGRPAPPPLALWLLAWLAAHRSFLAACQIRVAVGAWWWRRKRGRGSLRRLIGAAIPRIEFTQVRTRRCWGHDIDGTTDGQRVIWRSLLRQAATEAAQRTLKDALQNYGMDRTRRGHNRPHGRLPTIILRLDHVSQRSYMAHRAEMTRTATLSAFQTTLHPT